MLSRLPRKLDPWTVGLLLLAVVVLVFGMVSLSTASETVAESDSHAEPGTVEHVAGADVARVTLTESGAGRIGVKTAALRTELVAGQQRKVVPYAAVVYDSEGEAWVYASPQPLAYVREAIEIAQIVGDRAVLVSGPAVGTEIVTVGVAELYGTELGVGH